MIWEPTAATKPETEGLGPSVDERTALVDERGAAELALLLDERGAAEVALPLESMETASYKENRTKN